MEKKQTHVMSSFFWVNDPWSCQQNTHIRTKQPRTSKMCLCITPTTMTDLQADRGVDTHQGFLDINSSTQFDQQRHSHVYPCLPLCQIVPQSPFGPSACQHHISALSVRSVSSVRLCDRSSSGPCFNSSSFHRCCLSPTPQNSPSSHFIHLASRTCAVKNSYKPPC